MTFSVDDLKKICCLKKNRKVKNIFLKILQKLLNQWFFISLLVCRWTFLF